jgi:hypothetical protein
VVNHNLFGGFYGIMPIKATSSAFNGHVFIGRMLVFVFGFHRFA